ncbi:ATP-binding protein [Metabacillus sp. RGM 3146]|uniref:ATP-binding protein n=1 Tax=Metabacillus sp. RGM 3146 TaxID=3401092 RepID=UPI003B9D34E4
MSEKTLQKSRSPFFTTKEKGTGLRIEITEKIINQHNGIIEIESKEGKGTMSSTYLTSTKNEYSQIIKYLPLGKIRNSL